VRCPDGSTHCLSCTGTPIVLDVTGRGFDLTDAQNGVTFDINGDGNPVRIAWTAAGANNAFLVLPASDGFVHSGLQLFGNKTPQPPSDNPNGFTALAVYDDPKNGGNGDGVIDSRDAIFSSLRLWIDANHDGISQPEELHTLPSLGINSISLNYSLSEKHDAYGNVFHYRSLVNPDASDAARVGRVAYDIYFIELPSATKCVVPQIRTKTGGF
jgi:hypothetical protein